MIIESAPPAISISSGVKGNITNGAHRLSTNGMNGFNGHSPYQLEGPGPDQCRVYILSAKDSATCWRMAQDLAEYLRQSIQEDQEPPASDLAYTLSARRTHLPWMMATRSRKLKDLAERLEEPIAKPLNCAKQPRLGFVFNGQGAQWHAMGRELITAYPIFGASIHKADRVFRDYGADWSLYGMCASTQI